MSNQIQLNIRISKEMKLFLVEQAKNDGRSLNNFIVKTFEELKVNQKKIKAQ
ncbi:toxin-antitoxin system HicB family antitoxin [Acinetobacter chinensis]|uniref:toxin-antitoxin system HicB family antitoxin n=1 Tax=Acinetobacter chinensis TaxID=2004650 RepID=UPI0029350622|nr:toxin-antitoxin system HicB family antitoxin [Acinetobacter chinensis]WOE40075.1 toxin-antitoxin system HicB family antitoxin [Acinetobacter chinensis]